MATKIPYPGKLWAKNKAFELSTNLQREIQKLDRAELDALIKTCKTFNHTNCAWTSFALKEAIIYLAESQLQFITPISQQKKLKNQPL